MAEVETVLVTGCAGFIGMHLTRGLLAEGFRVVGVDNLNDYYDVQLKIARLRELRFNVEGDEDSSMNTDSGLTPFVFVKQDIAEVEVMSRIIKNYNVSQVFHLAAQAGVRYSIDNPQAYIDSNVVGTTSLLQACRMHRVEHVYLASSSSVYGAITETPFREDMTCDTPLSIYAATKASTELIAHAYSKLFQLKVTALRFFTVYGPWDRPDMALHKFVERIRKGKQIDVYNNGDMQRDFTYVEDLVRMVLRLSVASTADNDKLYQVFNVGSGNPVSLSKFIGEIQKALDREALIRYLPMQPGDLKQTYADMTKLTATIGSLPKTKLDFGIAEAVRWHSEYYGQV
ncbi:MAG: GDP-mannose 4,6-dehydratase [Flavobacteriales bacterium]|nr:GDP-mannose 4,6-dehydratase [Flavobacteriales bacterium]